MHKMAMVRKTSAMVKTRCRNMAKKGGVAAKVALRPTRAAAQAPLYPRTSLLPHFVLSI